MSCALCTTVVWVQFVRGDHFEKFTFRRYQSGLFLSARFFNSFPLSHIMHVLYILTVERNKSTLGVSSSGPCSTSYASLLPAFAICVRTYVHWRREGWGVLIALQTRFISLCVLHCTLYTLQSARRQIDRRTTTEIRSSPIKSPPFFSLNHAQVCRVEAKILRRIMLPGNVSRQVSQSVPGCHRLALSYLSLKP